MDSARWQRIQDVFHDAVDLPQTEQVTFVKATCGDNEELKSEVLAMLHQDAGGNSLLDRSLADLAREKIRSG